MLFSKIIKNPQLEKIMSKINKKTKVTPENSEIRKKEKKDPSQQDREQNLDHSTYKDEKSSASELDSQSTSK
jgi:hypothetical protein